MKSFIWHGSVLPKACGILFACALMLAPEPTFAQHGGGGGHAGGHFGGGHLGGGRGHAPPLVGFGTHNSGVVGKQAVVMGNRVVTPEQIFPPRRFPRFLFSSDCQDSDLQGGFSGETTRRAAHFGFGDLRVANRRTLDSVIALVAGPPSRIPQRRSYGLRTEPFMG